MASSLPVVHTGALAAVCHNALCQSHSKLLSAALTSCPPDLHRRESPAPPHMNGSRSGSGLHGGFRGILQNQRHSWFAEKGGYPAGKGQVVQLLLSTKPKPGPHELVPAVTYYLTGGAGLSAGVELSKMVETVLLSDMICNRLKSGNELGSERVARRDFAIRDK